jgi:transposase InsO family protein
MTANGDPYENTIAERVIGILQCEFNLGSSFKSFDLASEAVTEAIKVYNLKRPHLSFNYLTPNAAHEYKGILKRQWKQHSSKRKNLKTEAILSL